MSVMIIYCWSLQNIVVGCNRRRSESSTTLDWLKLISNSKQKWEPEQQLRRLSQRQCQQWHLLLVWVTQTRDSSPKTSSTRPGENFKNFINYVISSLVLIANWVSKFYKTLTSFTQLKNNWNKLKPSNRVNCCIVVPVNVVTVLVLIIVVPLAIIGADIVVPKFFLDNLSHAR